MTKPAKTKHVFCECGGILPTYADRATVADLVTRLYFPVTARTIRTWPLVARHPNKKAVLNVREALEYAAQKLANSPGMKQGG